MLKTLKIKLLPNNIQHSQLIETMQFFNKACNEISNEAFVTKIYSKFKLQKIVYYNIRNKYKLSAQLTIRAISKVCESYKTDNKTLHLFKDTGAIVYDDRIMSFKGLTIVSLDSVYGRLLIPIIISSYHQGLLGESRIRGQADLILQNNIFYLMLIIETEDDKEFVPVDYIGVDLGIKNIATTSDGINYSGNKLNNIRKRKAKLRSKLQSINTKSAKRKLKKISGKDKRFVNDINHCISKQLVKTAKDTHRGISLERLKGIRKNVKTVNKAQRSKLSSWSFYKLQSFIGYKAKEAGVPIKYINPKNTSRTCPKCGHIDKKNRPTRDLFCCTACGFSAPADNVASENIRRAALSTSQS
jgi:IS605 OrfB family transposase